MHIQLTINMHLLLAISLNNICKPALKWVRRLLLLLVKIIIITLILAKVHDGLAQL